MMYKYNNNGVTTLTSDLVATMLVLTVIVI